MDAAANAPAIFISSGAGGGGLIALVQAILQDLRSPGLTTEERELVARLKEVSSVIGPYVLGAEDREDILARVDAILDDPEYYARVLLPMGGPRPIKAGALQTTGKSPGALSGAVGPWLGPAALPYLRDLERTFSAYTQWLLPALAKVPPASFANAMTQFAAHPLDFINSPSIPVPVAKSLLAGFRNDLFIFSACDLAFTQRSVAPWLGLAFAETWAATMREALVLPASLGGGAIPLDIVPPENRLDIAALDAVAALTVQAYSRFNTDAENSGAPIYPAVP